MNFSGTNTHTASRPASVPAAAVTVTATAPADVQDWRLQSDGIALLGRLEHSLSRIDTARHAHDRGTALESARVMLVELLDFVTVRFGIESLTPRLTRLCALRDSITELQRTLPRGMWGQFFRADAATRLGRQKASDQIGRDVFEVFGDLLSIADCHFQSPRRAADWQAACRVLLEDLRRKW